MERENGAAFLMRARIDVPHVIFACDLNEAPVKLWAGFFPRVIQYPSIRLAVVAHFEESARSVRRIHFLPSACVKILMDRCEGEGVVCEQVLGKPSQKFSTLVRCVRPFLIAIHKKTGMMYVY